MKKEYLNTGRKNQKMNTRKKILLSTQDFLTKGQKFTLEDVAEHAGLSRATIYRYYSNVDILANEAVLDLNTNSPEEIYEDLKHLDLPDLIFGIQAYWNRFTLHNEGAFRKYLSVVITDDSPAKKRGARRSKTLKLALAEPQVDLDEEEKTRITNMATLFMGMEALIVMKDVCGLDDEEALQSLKWGLEMMLKGILAQEQAE